ncbi:MAG: DUF637 domain-containing protein, partial [Aeromonas veronii]
ALMAMGVPPGWQSALAHDLLAGVLTGEFDLEATLKSMAMAGLSEAINARILESDFAQGLNQTGLSGGAYFSEAHLFRIATGAVVEAGLTTGIYGGDFGDNLARAFTSAVISEAVDLGFNLAGDLKGSAGLANGSLGAGLIHGLVGCAAADARGGTCAGGFISALGNELLSGRYDKGFVPDPSKTAAENEAARTAWAQRNAKVAGLILGTLTSGGDTANVTRIAGITQSAHLNNRQMHPDLAEVIFENSEDFAVSLGLCRKDLCTADDLSIARAYLAAAAYARDDASADAVIYENDLVKEALAFLNDLTARSSNVNLRAATEAERNDPTQNLDQSYSLLITTLNADITRLQASGTRQIMGWDQPAVSPTTLLFFEAFNQGNDGLAQLRPEVMERALRQMKDEFEAFSFTPNSGSALQYVNAARFIEGIRRTNPVLAQRYMEALYGEGARVEDISYFAAAATAWATQPMQEAVANDLLGGGGAARYLTEGYVITTRNGVRVIEGPDGKVYGSANELPDSAWKAGRPPEALIPDGWTKLNPVGAGISTPKGFTSYRTADGEIIHVSPGGLLYGTDPKFGNRVDHVLDHTAPNASKPVHSVFNVQGDDALALVDEAWAKRIGAGTLQANGNRSWIVDLGRPVGSTNVQTSVQIVVRDGTNELITAYPK